MSAMTTKPRSRRGAATIGLFAVLVTALLATRLFPALPAVAAPSSPLEERIDAIATNQVGRGGLAGLSVAVSRGGESLLSKGYGYADLSRRTPADARTIYRIGSINKQFAAAAILKLVEKGELGLDDSVADLLPGFSSQHPVTVRQILGHTSGLANLGAMPGFSPWGVGVDREGAIDWIGSERMEFAPGTNFSYNNSGYVLAGRIVDELAGSTESFMREHLLGPLGLRDTTFCTSRPEGERWAMGYEPGAGRWGRTLRLGLPVPLVEAPAVNMELVSSMGPTCSTVSDLVRWNEALHGGEVLSETGYRAMTQHEELPDGRRSEYGLGLYVRDVHGHRAVSHGGIISGFVSQLAYFPDDDTTVVLLVNTLPSSLPEGLWREIVGAVLE